MIDHNLFSPDDLTVLLKRPLDQILTNREVERLEKILYNYDYYSGKQHKNIDGMLIRSHEMERPPGYDYDPAYFETNYFKAFIKRKSRWQMAGKHGIEAIPKSDSPEDIEKAQAYEELLRDIWKYNKMDAKKMSLARDRMVGGTVACKLSYNPHKGKIHWIWHKAHEVFPIYSEDGFNEMTGCDIIIPKDDPVNEGRTLYYVQHFRMDEDSGECFLEEVVYDDKFKRKEVLVENGSLQLDFVPIVMFDVENTDGNGEYFDDLEDIEILTTQLNKMMEDASDSLAFEMFGITVITNAKEGTAQQLEIAPGAVVEVNSNHEGISAGMHTLENGFQWKEAYKDQYNRIKSALHELSGLPQIVPQELNFGGMNDRALQVLYQDIIQETTEQWLAWDVAFAELYEKTIGYLNARTYHNKFSYDKTVVRDSEGIETKMNFVLPLPDDRADLIELLASEVDHGFESLQGAQKRAGVVDTDKKIQEIKDERTMFREAEDPYNTSSELSTRSNLEADASAKPEDLE